MSTSRLFAIAAILSLALSSGSHAQGPDADTKAVAERAVQAYLAMWSRDDRVNEASITRFYAPRVVYFGKAMSRAQILADKRAYIQHWPVRQYTEVPGSFVARCDADRSHCEVKADMTWRRVSHSDRVSTGRARMIFEFVPADGGRKIARESARILSRNVRCCGLAPT